MPCSSGPSPDDIFHNDQCDEKSLRIKHEDDTFFTRLLSKETSKSNPSSFRLLYYGDVSSATAVPFTWETRPGTPKHPASQQNNSSCINIPPPPSYYTSNQLLYRNSSSSSSSTSKLLLHALFRRMNPVKKSHFIPSSPSSSSSLSSLSNLSSSPQYYSGNSSSDSTIGKPGYGDVHRSCLGNINNTNNIGNYKEKRRLRLRSVLMLKKAFLSIVGRGSRST